MGILTGLGRWLGLAQSPDPATRQAIARAVETVDPLLKVVSGYERKLAPAVRRALDHCAELAAAIPGPVDISSRAFGADPLVHAMFAAPSEIAEMLGRSREVRKFLAESGQSETEDFFALLGMRQREKTVMGMALRGETLQTQVPQVLLCFADHTLGELGGSHEITRQRLQAAAFDSLIHGFAGCVAEFRQERNGGSDERDVAQAGDADRQQGLVECPAIVSLAPEDLLHALIEWLAAPQEHLYLQPTEVIVDHMGVISPNAVAEGNFSTLKFPRLVGRDRRQWIVLVTRISRQDAVNAVRSQEQANRFLLI
jgi:hypothetical protein